VEGRVLIEVVAAVAMAAVAMAEAAATTEAAPLTTKQMYTYRVLEGTPV
jgi:hypothetical protein